MRREEHYVGRKAMGMKVHERKKRESPKRRWLDKVKDAIKDKGLAVDVVYDRATWMRIYMSSYNPHIKVVIRCRRRRICEQCTDQL